MVAVKRGDTHLVRLERGEELGAAVLQLARERGIRCASVSGIGALQDCEFGYYFPDRKEYDRRTFPEIVELVSLLGNLSLVDGAPFLHAHAVCMRADRTMTGGHFFRGIVAITVELWIREFDAEVTRVMDEEIGLKLLRFPREECGPKASGAAPSP